MPGSAARPSTYVRTLTCGKLREAPAAGASRAGAVPVTSNGGHPDPGVTVEGVELGSSRGDGRRRSAATG